LAFLQRLLQVMRFRFDCPIVVAGLLLFAASGSLTAQTVAPSTSSPDATPPAGASPDQVTAPVINKAHNSTYVIGDDDELEIDVWKEPDLTRRIPVRSDGKISLPLVGELQAAGWRRSIV
jgi:polysaccharide export outer membrane protein